MPKEFESGSRYQGYAQTQGYDPIKPVDVTLSTGEQTNRTTNLQRMLDQSLQAADQRSENKIYWAQNRIADLVAYRTTDLATLQTLTNALPPTETSKRKGHRSWHEFLHRWFPGSLNSSATKPSRTSRYCQRVRSPRGRDAWPTLYKNTQPERLERVWLCPWHCTAWWWAVWCVLWTGR